jgi:hypothetical protein
MITDDKDDLFEVRGAKSGNITVEIVTPDGKAEIKKLK